MTVSLWVNGERLSSDGRHLSASDRGLTLADGVFETMRARGGAVFRLDRHLARLVQALVALEIPVQPELRDWVLDAARASGDCDVSVRLTVTRGVGPGGLAPPADARPTAIVAVKPASVIPSAVHDV